MKAFDSGFRPTEYLGLRYWPTWFTFGVLWLCARLPYPALMWLGRRLGELLGVLHVPRRRIANTNLALCFPDYSEQQRRTLLWNQFRALGMSLFEMGALWFGSREQLRARLTISGIEHLIGACDDGRGAIVLQAHFTTLELGANLLAMETPLDANYDPPKNPLYAAFLLYQRQRNFNEMIDNRSMRRMARNLRGGGSVWYSPDQYVKPGRGGVATQFFSLATNTTDATSRIAKLTGAAVIPFLPVRTSKHGHYELRLYPPLPDFPSDDASADTQRINDLFEMHIRAFPEQYFWVHKRFKRSSDTQEDYYQ